MICAGLSGNPLNRISKCKWVPEAFPVIPPVPMKCPAFTTSPSLTLILLR
jgi:hypothetical protein